MPRVGVFGRGFEREDRPHRRILTPHLSLTRLPGVLDTRLATLRGRDTTVSQHGGGMRTVVTVADTFITSKWEGRCLAHNIHPNSPNIMRATLVKARTRVSGYRPGFLNMSSQRLTSASDIPPSPPLFGPVPPRAFADSLWTRTRSANSSALRVRAWAARAACSTSRSELTTVQLRASPPSARSRSLIAASAVLTWLTNIAVTRPNFRPPAAPAGAPSKKTSIRDRDRRATTAADRSAQAHRLGHPDAGQPWGSGCDRRSSRASAHSTGTASRRRGRPHPARPPPGSILSSLT